MLTYAVIIFISGLVKNMAFWQVTVSISTSQNTTVVLKPSSFSYSVLMYNYGCSASILFARTCTICGKTTELVHPRNFQYGLVIWHTKKERKNFWGVACGKRGIALFGVKSIECCKKRLNDVIVFFCLSFTVHHNPR